MQPELQICFPGVCQREMLQGTPTALLKIQLQPRISCLWIHQVQIPELLLKEGRQNTKERETERERKGWMYFKGKEKFLNVFSSIIK